MVSLQQRLSDLENRIAHGFVKVKKVEGIRFLDLSFLLKSIEVTVNDNLDLNQLVQARIYKKFNELSEKSLTFTAELIREFEKGNESYKRYVEKRERENLQPILTYATDCLREREKALQIMKDNKIERNFNIEEDKCLARIIHTMNRIIESHPEIIRKKDDTGLEAHKNDDLLLFCKAVVAGYRTPTTIFTHDADYFNLHDAFYARAAYFGPREGFKVPGENQRIKIAFGHLEDFEIIDPYLVRQMKYEKGARECSPSRAHPVSNLR